MPDVSTIYNSHGTRCAGLVAAVVSIHVYMYTCIYICTCIDGIEWCM